MAVCQWNNAAVYAAFRVMAQYVLESVQRIIKRRALECQHPQTTDEIIGLLEATVIGWNLDPTEFEWGGKRAARRERSRQRRRHWPGGSGAVAGRAIRNRRTLSEQWLSNCQMTH